MVDGGQSNWDATLDDLAARMKAIIARDGPDAVGYYTASGGAYDSAGRPTIGVPTLTLDPDRDPFTAPGGGAAYRDRFTGAYEHRTLTGVGHNVPQEAPTAFARAVVDAGRL